MPGATGPSGFIFRKSSRFGACGRCGIVRDDSGLASTARLCGAGAGAGDVDCVWGSEREREDGRADAANPWLTRTERVSKDRKYLGPNDRRTKKTSLVLAEPPQTGDLGTYNRKQRFVSVCWHSWLGRRVLAARRSGREISNAAPLRKASFGADWA